MEPSHNKIVKELTRQLFLIILLFIYKDIQGQLFRTAQFWKYYRNSFHISLGATNFLGEVGGRDQIGSPFLWDLEIVATRPSIQIGYGYNITEDITLMINGAWGILTGADSLTKEPFRHNRNITFKSNLWELALIGRYKILQEETAGKRYKLRKVRGKKAFVFGIWVEAGLGFFFFEPKAQYKGRWYKLRTLSTEGQGIKPGTKPYKNYSFAIPLNFGFTYSLDIKNRIELGVSWRKTFTDYIDDTSTEYYDKEQIRAYKGDVAAYFSNPCICTEDWQKWSTKPGQQRGDPKDKDAYVLLYITYTKLFRANVGPKTPRWLVKRKSRPSF